MNDLVRFGRTLPGAPGEACGLAKGPDWVQCDPDFLERASARAQARPGGGWVVVDASRRLGPGPRRYDLAGAEWVAWRDAEGVVVAPNACPHLGAELCGGSVREGPYASCTATAEYDDFADGSVDSRFYLTFDANGAVTRHDTESRADGTITSTIEWTNDSDGRAIEQRTDSGADGTAEVIDVWTYDADGNKATWTQDEDGDGTADSGSAYTYDGSFLLRWDMDENLDGTADHATTVTWTHGTTDVGVHESDEGLDGDVDFWSAYEYASSGLLLSQEVDWEVDGVVDLVYEYIYDAADRLERFQYTYDSVVDSYTFTYDENGREVLDEYDVHDDGVLDGVMTYTYWCPGPT